MSEYPGPKLEDLLRDTFGVSPSDEFFPGLVQFYEPYREQIERRLDDFDEDEHGSWRDYKYEVMWDNIPDPPEEVLPD